MPEEIKGLLRVIVKENDELRELVKGLDGDVRALTARYKRDKWERAAIVGVLILSIALVSLYIRDALDRRAEFREQIRQLACLAVARTPAGVSLTVDDLRSKYHCAPYHALPSTGASRPSALPRATATATATTTATATRTAEGRPHRVVVTAPGPTSTRVVTRTAVVPMPIRTTRTVTVTATPSCRLLPGLLC